MLTKIPIHNFNKNHCQGARASDRIANLLSLPLTKAGFGFQQHSCLHCKSVAPAFLLIKSGAPCPDHSHAAGPCNGVGCTGLHTDSAVTRNDHRGGRCCGQAPRPLSVLAEMRVSPCSYSGENHSKNRLGT